MKYILLDIINNDKTYNKSATRYLYKTHPDIWQEILDITSFLPVDALPKQRIWHILNDVWEIPKCPVTGENVKWFENRYLKTKDRTAKTKLQHLRGDFENNYSTEINQKRKASNLEAVKKGRKYRDKSTYSPESYEKAKKTWTEKYGVDNPSKHIEVRNKISEIRISKGAIPKEKRSLKRLYYEQVSYFTKLSWKFNFDKINPNRLNRSEVDLDHIYSKYQGFIDNIPPYIIGHWTNLQMLEKRANYSKGEKCGKSREQLFEDFFSNYPD